MGGCFLFGVVRIGDHVLGLHVLRYPLVRTCGALGQFPLVAEERVEVAVVPRRGIRFPSTFQATGDGITTLATAVGTDPAEALCFQWSSFRFRTDQRGISGTVHLSEGVTTSCEGHGLFVVHGHAFECLTHIAATGQGIRVAVRALRVHIDQAHLHGSERVLENTFARVAAIRLVAGGEPLVFRAPVDVLFGLPDIGTATTETKGLEAHALHGNVAGEHEEIRPGHAVAVFLFDGPQQASRLVQVAIVRPAVHRSETLVASASPSTTIGRAVGACNVPGHAYEQSTIVSPVSGPPVLRIRHHLGEVGLQRFEVDLLEGFCIIEIRPQRIGCRRVLMQDADVQLVRPPILVPCTTTGHGVAHGTVHDGAFTGRSRIGACWCLFAFGFSVVLHAFRLVRSLSFVQGILQGCVRSDRLPLKSHRPIGGSIRMPEDNGAASY